MAFRFAYLDVDAFGGNFARHRLIVGAGLRARPCLQLAASSNSGGEAFLLAERFASPRTSNGNGPPSCSGKSRFGAHSYRNASRFGKPAHGKTKYPRRDIEL